MFQRESIIKKYSFICLDLISVVLAFYISLALRFQTLHIMREGNLYVHFLVVASAACVIGNLAFKLDKHIFDRGLYEEFVAVIKGAIVIAIIVLAYLFMSQEGIQYSRAMFLYFFGGYICLTYFIHLFAKPIIATAYKNSSVCKKIMLITSIEKVDAILERLKKTNNWYFDMAYIALVDEDRVGESIDGIPVIATLDNMMEASKSITLDGVFINLPHRLQEIMDITGILHDFQKMGVTVHVNIDALELDMTNKMIDNLGWFKVVSYRNRLFDPWQLVLKRCMDIVGGFIGLLVTIIISIILIPAILIESPGNPIYTQIRVGKNGRRFKMYKFRSMYQDADKRKKELLDKNQMSGAIFKIENDPRVTRVGKFIRKYSIDEMPQFWNVLVGDMSLVGTRPPLVEEVEKYQVTQKARLSVTPGLTGLWQTSGRSDILDFDEIVKLDMQYIDHWSLLLDIKLIIKTIYVCISGKGAK